MEIRSWIIALLMVSVSFAAAAGKIAPPPEGGTLPEILLPAPENSEHRRYLGIPSGQGNFRIPEIDAEVVIVEIFSMY